MSLIGHSLSCTSIADGLRVIHKLGGNAIQVALGSADSRVIPKVDPKDAITACKIRCKHNFYVVVHGKYLYNFCRPPSGIKWQHKLLVDELREAAKLNADVIIHQGKNVKELKQSNAVALEQYVANLIVVLDSSTTTNKIILENSSRQGTERGYALSELADIYSAIPDAYKERIGFCIDLCHIFVSGELDMRDATRVRKWFQDFDALIGLKKLTVIHFNDSGTQFNGANDNHAMIEKGYIGAPERGGNNGGFKVVAQLCDLHQIPMILETPSGDMQGEIQLLQQYI